MIVERLHPTCYEAFQREYLLREQDANVDYELKVRLQPSSNNGLFIDLPKMKEQANYLQHNTRIVTPPKDCDAIIVDLDARIVYLIEMKRSSAASTNEEIAQQLAAGERWWQHLVFCMGIDEPFQVKKVAVMVEERRSRARRVRGEDLNFLSDYGFYKRLGDSLPLMNIT